MIKLNHSGPDYGIFISSKELLMQVDPMSSMGLLVRVSAHLCVRAAQSSSVEAMNISSMILHSNTTNISPLIFTLKVCLHCVALLASQSSMQRHQLNGSGEDTPSRLPSALQLTLILRRNEKHKLCQQKSVSHQHRVVKTAWLLSAS